MADGSNGGGSPLCQYCGEPMLASEHNRFNFLHTECGARGIYGSVAHQQQRCCCFVPGSTEEDPPGMTLREAARAAYELWQKNHAVL